MGKSGPPPEPIALRVLKGNPSRRPVPKGTPQPRAGVPDRPIGMSAKARAVWRRLVRDYEHTGVLTGVDGDALRIYCEAVVRYEQGAQLLERSGPLVKGARLGELVKNPLHQIVRDNAELVRAFGRELGFTPSARSALREMKPPADGDPLDAWEKSG